VKSLLFFPLRIVVVLAATVSFLPAILFAADKMPIGTNFWDLGWHAKTDIFAPGWDNVSGSNPWNPQFLVEIDKYANLRFMDWDKTNGSNRVDFSERVLKSATTQRPVAYEWMIDLCNRTNADMWVCIPHKANWEYSTHLARLILYGSNAAGVPYTSIQANPVNPPLNENLKLYVEYSNETWNGSFAQYQYCFDQGVALDLPGMNQYYQGWAYHVYAAIRHFERFEAVFGANHPRLVKVLAGQSGNSAVCGHHVSVLGNSTVNPNGVTVNAYAIAPYIGSGIDGAAADAVDQLRAAIPARVQQCVNHRTRLNGTGIPLICYEGGQHLLTNAHILSANQGIYDVYSEYLNAIDDHVQGVFSHYAHVGSWGSGGAWGAMRFTGQPIADAPKYRALMDYMNTADAPPGKAVSPAPADGATNVSVAVGLGWTAGARAQSHNLYFGTNPAPSAGEFKGSIAATQYNPGALNYSTTYYWRVDEVNTSGTTTGDVWSFTTRAEGGTGPFLETGGIVSMEAEHGEFSVSTRWNIHDDAGASNGQYIEIDPAFNQTNNPPTDTAAPSVATYHFQTSTAGNHAFHLRVSCPGGGADDSVYFRLNDGDWITWNSLGAVAWHWSKNNHAIFDNLAAGRHKFEILYRENGTRLDKLLIQLDSLPDPTGLGPDESGRETETPSAATASFWHLY
jgi:hypothetical protein